jgi:Lar family restriction alleviation protein
MEVKLLPCPFCGGAEKWPPYVSKYMLPEIIEYLTVVCGNCSATCGHCASEEEAIEAWNRRA